MRTNDPDLAFEIMQEVATVNPALADRIEGLFFREQGILYVFFNDDEPRRPEEAALIRLAYQTYFSAGVYLEAERLPPESND
ncbi:MAG TPA: hypothetical protein PK417_08095 [Hyphomonas sp.]|nr:hypothetical protein [Hyphomonas sp.]